eukprot:scaffold51266_cov69-Phaeocystis_antarctica.AAC.2
MCCPEQVGRRVHVDQSRRVRALREERRRSSKAAMLLRAPEGTSGDAEGGDAEGGDAEGAAEKEHAGRTEGPAGHEMWVHLGRREDEVRLGSVRGWHPDR